MLNVLCFTSQSMWHEDLRSDAPHSHQSLTDLQAVRRLQFRDLQQRPPTLITTLRWQVSTHVERAGRTFTHALEDDHVVKDEPHIESINLEAWCRQKL
eukprot:5559381-Amphidinium_carterae.1